MAVITKIRQSQLIFVAINYGLVYWLIARLKEDGYVALFIVLLVILSIERFLIILKMSFIFILGNELWAIPVNIITNLLGCDISLG